MLKTISIDLQVRPLIDGPPKKNEDLWKQACSSDQITIDTWRQTWINNVKVNKEHFGDFGSKSIGKLYGINRYRPAIICGSGPSLKNSIEALKENKKMEHPLLTVSCLHNFGYFEDEGVHADYYVTLDAGDIILNDVHEGRPNPPEYYWEKTKDKKLIACVTTPKKLFELWQGEIYLFQVMVPEVKLQSDIQAIEKFSHYVSAGGNALGGCLYVAQSLMCSHVIHFVGADFCFDYDNTFHSYKTHYDSLGGYVPWPDIYGMPRKTWPSYFNFKTFFDWVACNVPGRYVNCSEGILGSYPEGNIRQFQYMSLKDALIPYHVMERVFLQKKDAYTGDVLSKDEVSLKEMFANPQYHLDVALI